MKPQDPQRTKAVVRAPNHAPVAHEIPEKPDPLQALNMHDERVLKALVLWFKKMLSNQPPSG